MAKRKLHLFFSPSGGRLEDCGHGLPLKLVGW
jgi:hypothetical protein